MDYQKFDAVDKDKLIKHAPNANVIKLVDTGLFKQRLRDNLKTK